MICDMAFKFMDVDLAALLVCIDAVKASKYWDCVIVTVTLVEVWNLYAVLQYWNKLSIVIEPFLSMHPISMISEEAIIPILGSIIEASGNSLKQLQLPRAWIRNKSQMLNDFLSRYNQRMNDKQLPCSACTEIVQGANHHPWIYVSGRNKNYGLQNYTCYDCKKQSCHGAVKVHKCLAFAIIATKMLVWIATQWTRVQVAMIVAVINAINLKMKMKNARGSFATAGHSMIIIV